MLHCKEQYCTAKSNIALQRAILHCKEPSSETKTNWQSVCARTACAALLVQSPIVAIILVLYCLYITQYILQCKMTACPMSLRWSFGAVRPDKQCLCFEESSFRVLALLAAKTLHIGFLVLFYIRQCLVLVRRLRSRNTVCCILWNVYCAVTSWQSACVYFTSSPDVTEAPCKTPHQCSWSRYPTLQTNGV